jgi:hypothetical protein
LRLLQLVAFYNAGAKTTQLCARLYRREAEEDMVMECKALAGDRSAFSMLFNSVCATMAERDLAVSALAVTGSGVHMSPPALPAHLRSSAPAAALDMTPLHSMMRSKVAASQRNACQTLASLCASASAATLGAMAAAGTVSVLVDVACNAAVSVESRLSCITAAAAIVRGGAARMSGELGVCEARVRAAMASVRKSGALVGVAKRQLQEAAQGVLVERLTSLALALRKAAQSMPAVVVSAAQESPAAVCVC